MNTFEWSCEYLPASSIAAGASSIAAARARRSRGRDEIDDFTLELGHSFEHIQAPPDANG
jgi:hypothetical protein